jgi:ABC-2 type transport system permease protein
MKRPVKRPGFGAQLAVVTFLQLANWRWSWRGMLVLGIAAPLLSISILRLLTEASPFVSYAHFLTGNVVLALMFENQNKVAGNFAFMKAMGTLRYLATLPVSRAVVILASALSFFLLSLPAVGVTIVAGAHILGVTLAPSPWLALVLPLAAVPMAAVGALIGTLARTPEEAGSASLLTTLVFLACGPVLLPAERLPTVLATLSWASPATYAASALRQTLLGPVTSRLALDLAVLAGLALLLFWGVSRLLVWRRG